MAENCRHPRRLGSNSGSILGYGEKRGYLEGTWRHSNLDPVRLKVVWPFCSHQGSSVFYHLFV